MAEISEKELAERVAILRRLRTLLEEQRKKFREYLNILEKQEASIRKEDTDTIVAHAELEQSVAAGIANLQKVIVPMNEMYRATVKHNSPTENESVSLIQDDLNRLQEKVLAQNEKNRELLKAHLVQIRQQLEEFKNPYKNVSSIYAKKVAQGSLVTVEV